VSITNPSITAFFVPLSFETGQTPDKPTDGPTVRSAGVNAARE
jgi:hypothetical protein